MDYFSSLKNKRIIKKSQHQVRDPDLVEQKQANSDFKAKVEEILGGSKGFTSYYEGVGLVEESAEDLPYRSKRVRQ